MLKRRSHKKNSKRRKIFLSILKYFLLLFVLGIVFVAILFVYYGRDLPRPEKFTERPFIQSTRIYDRTGKVLLYDIYGEEKREVVSLDKIPDYLKNAVIASEDSRFYQHYGVDFRSIIRAILVDLKLKEPSQGASTISQQLIRSSFLTRKKTLDRKIKEIILTLELEQRYSKNEILEWYLNQIPFGANCYGVAAASQTYFKKDISNISLAEAATLTALIPAPSSLSPYGPNKTKLLEKKDGILSKMEKLDYITKEQMIDAQAEKLEFAEILQIIKAPHFVFYVKKYLEGEYGEDFLKEKGLKVYTTIDWDLQQFAEKTVEEYAKKFEKEDAHNIALVALDPKTGEILALVGSKNYFGESYPEGCEETPGKCLFDPYFDVATMGKRQPGSSFKPFVYAAAFKKGYTPETVLWDVQTEFDQNCDPNSTQEKDQYGLDCYHPHNYDGKFRGPVTLRKSLAQSLNLPSVKLLYLTGLENSLKTAKDFGITTLIDQNRYGLSLVLGGGEVNLLEMVSGYGVFATEGLKIPPLSILKIEDADKEIIKENKKEPQRVLDIQIARLINDILSDNNARQPVFAPYSALYFANYQVAAKTGTTQQAVDAWTIGYTPSVVVGVWVGNNDNSPMGKKTGIGSAAPIWRKVMEKILETKPAENFIKPNQVLVEKPILNAEIDVKLPHSILYYVNKDDPRGPVPSNPTEDPQYFSWEKGIENWLREHNWVFEVEK